MVIERESSQVEVIALDYYDGATEGFALAIGSLGVSYFKMIAWDDDQDQRLFVVVSIARLIFDTIFSLLSLSNDSPASKVWVPSWSFGNSQDEAKANKLVESCLTDIKSKGVLSLGSQVDSTSVDIFTINDSIMSSVERAIQKPEHLNDWLTNLKDNKD